MIYIYIINYYFYYIIIFKYILYSALYENQIEVIPSVIENLTQLETLY